MSKPLRFGLLAFAVLAVGTAVIASNSPGVRPSAKLHSAPQIKSGLWEFSDTSKVAGDTVISDAMLTRIPASQREQYLAETRKMIAQPTRERECVTQASFERRLLPEGDGCTQTVSSDASGGIVVLTECRAESGGLKQYTNRKVLTSSPMRVTTSIHAVVTQRGKSMTVDSIESGHWLSSSCGNLHGIQQLP